MCTLDSPANGDQPMGDPGSYPCVIRCASSRCLATRYRTRTCSKSSFLSAWAGSVVGVLRRRSRAAANVFRRADGRLTSGRIPRIGSEEDDLSTAMPSSSSDQPEPRSTTDQNQRERDDLFAGHFLCAYVTECRPTTALRLITTASTCDQPEPCRAADQCQGHTSRH